MQLRHLCALVLCLVPTVVWAGNPHFTSCSRTDTETNITIDGKETGLGNETQVHIVATAEAQCVNPGGKHPKAANKETVTAEGDFPVQNGQAVFTLTLTPVFSPDCAPPMTLVFTAVSACDVEHGECCAF